jgi:3-oxoacyl-ACP reductase-like protein
VRARRATRAEDEEEEEQGQVEGQEPRETASAAGGDASSAATPAAGASSAEGEADDDDSVAIVPAHHLLLKTIASVDVASMLSLADAITQSGADGNNGRWFGGGKGSVRDGMLVKCGWCFVDIIESMDILVDIRIP